MSEARKNLVRRANMVEGLTGEQALEAVAKWAENDATVTELYSTVAELGARVYMVDRPADLVPPPPDGPGGESGQGIAKAEDLPSCGVAGS